MVIPPLQVFCMIGKLMTAGLRCQSSEDWKSRHLNILGNRKNQRRAWDAPLLGTLWREDRRGSICLCSRCLCLVWNFAHMSPRHWKSAFIIPGNFYGSVLRSSVIGMFPSMDKWWWRECGQLGDTTKMSWDCISTPRCWVTGHSV